MNAPVRTPVVVMSESDRYILSQIIAQEREANAPRSRDSDYFEIFAAEQVLKQRGYDLDPEQIRSGLEAVRD